MTNEQAIQIVRRTIGGERQEHFERTVKVSESATRFVTGDGLSELLVQFTRRESQAAFMQRKEITKHIAHAVVGNILDVFHKVPRANFARVVDTGKSETTVELERIIRSFWGDASLDDYMSTRFIELNGVDPNAFVVVEFEPFDGAKQRVQPYPFEVKSSDAVNFKYENNSLQWLIVHTVEAVILKDEMTVKKVSKYTMYLQDRTIIVREVPEIDGQMNESDEMIEVSRKWYSIEYPKAHNAGFVPAVRVGVVRDQTTGGATFLPLFASAIPYLEKSLKINSELDLSISLFAFPLSIRYEEPCDEINCYGGQNTASRVACSTCHGTGFKSRPTSAQEELVLALPAKGEQLQDLSNMIVYKSPPTDTLTFMDEYVDKLTERCKQAVFNTDIFTRTQIADTATGKRLDLDNVYDTLYKVAIKYSNTWEYLVKTCASFADLSANLKAVLVFSKDFRLKGLNELINDLEAANRAEAGSEVRNAIQEQIARLLHADDELEYSRYITKEYHNPFQGKSTSEVMILLQMPTVRQKDKVLYSNLEAIFDELERENKDFYKLTREMQTAKVEEKVSVIQGEIAAAAAAALPKLKMI